MTFIAALSGKRTIHRSTYRLSPSTFATQACGEVKGRVATHADLYDDASVFCLRCEAKARVKTGKTARAEATR